MPPHKKAPRWGEDERKAILEGFEKLNWDPSETSGPTIKSVLKGVPPHIFNLLQPHFAVNDGGTKANNNALFGHYKSLGCEFIVSQMRLGIWRKDGALLLLAC